MHMTVILSTHQWASSGGGGGGRGGRGEMHVGSYYALVCDTPVTPVHPRALAMFPMQV